MFIHKSECIFFYSYVIQRPLASLKRTITVRPSSHFISEEVVPSKEGVEQYLKEVTPTTKTVFNQKLQGRLVNEQAHHIQQPANAQL